MKGRKRLYLLALAALLGIVAGCGTKGGEMGSMESQDMEAVEEAQNETSQENAAQDGESAEAFVEAPAQNERLTKEGDGYGISIRIYHSDDMARCVTLAGLEIEEIHDGLGLGHSIMQCKRRK